MDSGPIDSIGIVTCTACDGSGHISEPMVKKSAYDTAIKANEEALDNTSKWRRRAIICSTSWTSWPMATKTTPVEPARTSFPTCSTSSELERRSETSSTI